MGSNLWLWHCAHWDGQPEHRLADRVHAVEHRFHAELFRVRAAFLVDHRIAQKTRGHHLVLRRIGQQVAGNLLDDEPVVRHVPVQCLDDPVAVEPYLARLVFLEAVGIGVARRVEPVAAPTLAVVRRIEQPPDLLLVGILAVVVQIGVDFVERGRQADEVEAQAPQQGFFRRPRRRRKPFLFQPREHEPVDRIYGPSRCARRAARAASPAGRTPSDA